MSLLAIVKAIKTQPLLHHFSTTSPGHNQKTRICQKLTHFLTTNSPRPGHSGPHQMKNWWLLNHKLTATPGSFYLTNSHPHLNRNLNHDLTATSCRPPHPQFTHFSTPSLTTSARRVAAKILKKHLEKKVGSVRYENFLIISINPSK